MLPRTRCYRGVAPFVLLCRRHCTTVARHGPRASPSELLPAPWDASLTICGAPLALSTVKPDSRILRESISDSSYASVLYQRQGPVLIVASERGFVDALALPRVIERWMESELCDCLPGSAGFTLATFSPLSNPKLSRILRIKSLPTIQFRHECVQVLELNGYNVQQRLHRFLEEVSSFLPKDLRNHKDSERSVRGAWWNISHLQRHGKMEEAYREACAMEEALLARHSATTQYAVPRVVLEKLAAQCEFLPHQLVEPNAAFRGSVCADGVRKDLRRIFEHFSDIASGPRAQRVLSAASLLASDRETMSLSEGEKLLALVEDYLDIITGSGNYEKIANNHPALHLEVPRPLMAPMRKPGDPTHATDWTAFYPCPPSVKTRILPTSGARRSQRVLRYLALSCELRILLGLKFARRGDYEAATHHIGMAHTVWSVRVDPLVKEMERTEGEEIGTEHHPSVRPAVALSNLLVALGPKHDLTASARGLFQAQLFGTQEPPQPATKPLRGTGAFGGVGRRCRGKKWRKWAWRGPDWKPAWVKKGKHRYDAPDWAWRRSRRASMQDGQESVFASPQEGAVPPLP